MNEVGRTVQRVNQPAILLVGVSSAPLFSNKTCLGKQLPQTGYYSSFRFLVDIRHIIVCVLLLNPLTAELLPLLTDKSPRGYSQFTHLQSQFG